MFYLWLLLFIELGIGKVSVFLVVIIYFSQKNNILMGNQCQCFEKSEGQEKNQIKVLSESMKKEQKDINEQLEEEVQEKELLEEFVYISHTTNISENIQSLFHETSHQKLQNGTKKQDLFALFQKEEVKEKQKQLGKFIYDRQEFQDLDAEQKSALIFDDAHIFKGQWKENMRNGRGKQLWKNGSMYEGYWKDNNFWGFGRFIDSQGGVYIGEWKNNQANGYGIYIYRDGSKYQGQWKNNQHNGFGKQKWANGTCFEGTYKMGKKNGLGKIKWSDGSYYHGQFQKDKIHGLGKYQWEDGRRYEGFWKDSEMHGRGNLFYPNGNKYEGYFSQNLRNGFGVLYFQNGKKFSGEWKNGKQHRRTDKNKKTAKGSGIWNQGKKLCLKEGTSNNRNKTLTARFFDDDYDSNASSKNKTLLTEFLDDYLK